MGLGSVKVKGKKFNVKEMLGLIKLNVNNMDIEKIKAYITTERYISAYELLLGELTASPDNRKAIELSKELSSHIRSRCMDLAYDKATEMSKEAFEMEALLKVVIRLNGETVYG